MKNVDRFLTCIDFSIEVVVFIFKDLCQFKKNNTMV
jgi:hypothetical protein